MRKISSETVGNLGTALALLAVGLSAYFMPHFRFGPYGLLDLKSFLQIVTALVCVQFVGSVAGRIFGRSAGTVISGFIGGFVSSTAVFASFGPRVRAKREHFGTLVASALGAVVAMLAEAFVIVAFISWELARPAASFFFPMLGGAIAMMTLVIWRTESLPGEVTNPVKADAINLGSIAKTSFFISLAFFVVALSNRWLGAGGGSLATFLTGLFEIHAVVYATADLFNRQEMSKLLAIENIALATAAGIFYKVGILWFSPRGRFALYVSFSLIILLIVGAISFFTWGR